MTNPNLPISHVLSCFFKMKLVNIILEEKDGLSMDKQKIGTFISSCRKEKGLTQAQLAEILGIIDKSISRWERGKQCQIYLYTDLYVKRLIFKYQNCYMQKND